MSSNLKDRLSQVTDTAPVSGLSDAARHAADRAGTVAYRAANIAGETAGTAASATKGAGSTVAHKISDASSSTARGGASAQRAAGKAAGKATGKAVAVSGRAGRKIEKARSRAELSSERAHAAAELRAERHRSRRAVAQESKARGEADKAQAILEKRLAKAETKLARVHRHRRRGLLGLVLLGAGAAGTIAVKRYLSAKDDQEPITATPAPIGDTSTPGTGDPLAREAFGERLKSSTNGLEEMPGVDTSLGEPSRPR
ncbi:hypothetical protein [Frankia sp. AgKG'84/4]|uniref:hypothetical protein n=1 Tax=Frankia sp. AgKG'84/4 TaxID=573490 RepID=UPI00201030A6|nr:hypothetical protein [Frankia sp. AgKG'84/4]MCL9796636.1 hypothetical protein [Frankia sp. AgKG'84/4]